MYDAVREVFLLDPDRTQRDVRLAAILALRNGYPTGLTDRQREEWLQDLGMAWHQLLGQEAVGRQFGLPVFAERSRRLADQIRSFAQLIA